MRGPSIERSRTLAGKIVPLVNPRDAPELCGLMREQLIDNDAVETKSCQRCHPSSPEIMHPPSSHRLRLVPQLGSGFCPRFGNRGVEVTLALRETRDRRWFGLSLPLGFGALVRGQAMCRGAENEIAPFNPRH